jgi:hypothetical protein
VRQAIADGLSLDETIQQVQVPDFTGYAIFEWVHSQLNVPAAYKEISTEGER